MSRIHVRVATLALCAVAWLAFVPAQAAAQQQSFRGEKWQFNIPLNFTFSKQIDGQRGSSLDVNNDLSWGLGFGYHFNDRFLLGFQTTWMSASYDAKIPVDDDDDGTEDGTTTVGGRLDTFSLLGVGQFNLMDKQFTPFLRGSLGYNYLDSNIASGPPQGSCWWDPWWLVWRCGAWQPTYTRSSFTFGGAAGLRKEFNRSFFIEASFNIMWVDWPESTPSFSAIGINFGWLF